jgi:hypothetical protein
LQAKVYQAEATARAETEAKATEAADSELAARMSQLERDEYLAAKLADHIEKEACAMEEEEKESRRLAEELQRAEDDEMAALKEQASKDELIARRSQQAEADALKKLLQEVTASWREPKLATFNVAEGVMVVTTLPNLKAVRVSANKSGAELTVTAVPDFSALLPSGDSLPEGMAPPPESVDVALDLKIVGKSDCSEDDVEVSYDRKSGKCRVLVRGAYVTQPTGDETKATAPEATGAAPAGLFARFRRGLSRVFSSSRGDDMRAAAATAGGAPKAAPLGAMASNGSASQSRRRLASKSMAAAAEAAAAVL